MSDAISTGKFMIKVYLVNLANLTIKKLANHKDMLRNKISFYYPAYQRSLQLSLFEEL